MKLNTYSDFFLVSKIARYKNFIPLEKIEDGREEAAMGRGTGNRRTARAAFRFSLFSSLPRFPLATRNRSDFNNINIKFTNA